MKIFNTVSILFLTTFFWFSPEIKSQIAIGEWRDHLPYNRTISVASADNLVFCATPYSLFYYDKTDNRINRLSKVNGLSDIGISCIAYNSEYQTLVVAYSNTNIDLIKGNSIINISDIKRKQILGNKTINNILFADSLAYLACGFGIVVLDVKNEEFPEPVYYIGNNGSQVNVFDLTVGMDTLYAATETGIYKAALNSPNLADFSFWDVDQKLYPNSAFSVIQYFHGKLFVNRKLESWNSDTTYYYDYSSDKWQVFAEADFAHKPAMKSMNDRFLLVSEGRLKIFDANLVTLTHIYSQGGRFVNLRDATIDADNQIWLADYDIGLIKAKDEWSGEFISPNGPFSTNVFDMSLENENLWVASGGHGSDWGKLYINSGAYSFQNEQWKSYNRANGFEAFDTISDMICVAVDPQNAGRAFVGSWQAGVMEFLNGELVNIYNDQNSSLEKWPAANFVAISGLAFDGDNNLWVVNSGAASVVSVMKPGGQWKSFSLGASASNIDTRNLIVDSYGQKWIMLRADNKLLVFTDNGTIDNINDDRVKTLSNSAGAGNLPGTKVYSIAQDLDGEIWLGTDEGVGVIYSPQNVFEGQAGTYDAQQIKVQVGGYVQYLLETETVTAIAVDGDNRKWMGTDRAGVYLLSADGTEEILHFTEENSPLYSNSIVDIEINGKTGEVFFGTDRGIISYKSTATEGEKTFDHVLVYPNPVREGYNGTIAISGLVEYTDIKITDIAGTLIFATRVDKNSSGRGGQAIWDGKNFDGRKASTGVYLVFATDDQGNEKMVTKILFIN